MKIRRMFLLTATIFTLLISSQVSFAEDVIVNRDTDKVNVAYKAVKTHTYKQGNPVEIENIRKDKEVVLLMDSSSAMNEFIKDPPDPFDYALFSGNEEDALTVRSTNIDINGGVHANHSLVIEGETIKLDGSFEAPVDVRIEGTNEDYSEDDVKKGCSVIEMQDLSDHFKRASELTETRFSTTVNPATGEMWYKSILDSGNFKDNDFLAIRHPGGGYKALRCDINAGPKWVLSGEELVLNPNKPLFFEGDVEFNLSAITGRGFIVATGNIAFNAGSFDDASTSEIGIYSVKGDIDLRTGLSGFQGVIYAPGDNDTGTGGTVRIGSGDLTVTGSIVAKNIQSGTGDVKITYKETTVHQQIKEYQRIATHMSVAKNAAIQFINKINTSIDPADVHDVKIGIVSYFGKAVIQGEEDSQIFFNAKTELLPLVAKVGGIEASEEDGCNLGDGLRRAYYMLENGDDYAEKYIVVLSATNPNKWTQDDLIPGTFEKDNGDIAEDSFLSGDGEEDVDGKGNDYALAIAGMVKASKKIRSYFVDVCSGEKLEKVETIAEAAGNEETEENEGCESYFYDPEGDEVGEGFEEAVYNVLTETIAGEITNRETYLAPSSVKATFTDLLPEGVKIQAADGFDISTELGRDKLTLKSDEVSIVTKIEGVITKATIPDLPIEIKYDKMINIGDDLKEYKVFDERDITFTFEFPNGDFKHGNATIEEITVTLIWDIDIN